MTTNCEFNLLHEPWIAVMREDGRTEEVSLTTLFKEANHIRSLAGELSTQDMAVFRLLLAILYATYDRKYSKDDNQDADEEEVLSRWNTIWNRGCFDDAAVSEYLNGYEDRFFLFHPSRPFYQVNIDTGTKYKASKMIGTLSESGHKVRFFASMCGERKTRISYGEATRWLLHTNAFDDTSAKTSIKNQPTGTGWLGQLGLIQANGRNLFETLMLNFVLLDRENEPFPKGTAPWELDEPKSDERTKISVPDNPLEILTLQSRRIVLLRDSDKVTGYKVIGGDIISKNDALIEHMTTWEKDERSGESWIPKRHDSSKSMWRDLSSIISKSQGHLKPGVVRWVSLLENEGYLPFNVVTFCIMGVKYGKQNSLVDDVFEDSLSLNSNLLANVGDEWVVRIEEMLDRTDRCVGELGKFFRNLSKAEGNKDNGSLNSVSESAKSNAFFMLDQPFRYWLASVEPGNHDMEIKINEWLNGMRNVVLSMGREKLLSSSESSFVGRGMKQNAMYYYGSFRRNVYKIVRGG